jgi:predicted flap endonuclease-1-like 5' DNA nuclease
MTELLWQATLLLAVAFFFGAVFACGLKRRYYYGTSRKASGLAVSGVSHAPAPNQPKIEVAPRVVAEDERFNRAISGQSAHGAPAARQSAPAPVAKAPPAAATGDLVWPGPTVVGSTASAKATAPAAAASAPAPAAPTAAPAPAPVAPPISSISVSSGSGAPVKPDQGGAGPSDDLTRIRGIDPEMQKRLKEAGVRRFQELAALTAGDVKGLNDRFDLKGRIDQDNWVGQAQVLATGGETYYSRRVDRGMPVPPTVEPASRVPAPEPAAPPVATRSFGKVAASAAPGDDLTRIRGIDAGLQRQLYEVGVRRFADLAVLGAGDARVLEQTLGIIGRIGPENWVGQAQVLADGGQTYYSSRIYSAAPAATPAAAPAPAAASAPAPTAPATATAPAEPAGGGDMGYLRSVRSEALLGAEAARSPRARPDVDDLKRIRGIGVLIEKKLNSLGIVHYEQVANWTGADIERISQILDFKGRIERENWIEQARILATGGQTEFSRRADG